MDRNQIQPNSFAHDSVLPPLIGLHAAEPPGDLSSRFTAYASADFADVVGPLYTMDSSIGPLHSSIGRLVGSALTVKAWPGDNLAIHGALTMARPGDVLVIDWRGYTQACGGGSRILVAAQRQGLVGVIIDGAWRDSAEIEEMGFPVFARGISIYSPAKFKPGEINVPVVCGGVVVEPGDVVVADREGIVVIQQRHIELVWHAVSHTLKQPAGDDEVAARAEARRLYFEKTFREAHGVRLDQNHPGGDE